MSASLNTADYTPVWNDNFAGSSSINSSIFPIRWGAASDFSFSGSGVKLTSNGSSSGFMNNDQGAADGYGYGLYQATFTMPQNQANGAYICLWPSTNVWPGPELDLVEQEKGQAYCTVHWAGSGGSNQSKSFDFNANLSQPTTVALDWEANSLTFYVDGQQIVQYTAGGSVPIPKDHADGGENSSFGIGNVGPAGTTITVSDLSYSASNGSAPAPVAPVAPVPVSPAPVTPIVPGTTIAVSSPGTVQEASPGAGASVPITISDPGLSQAYALVMNSNNVAEGNWTTVALNSAGQATQSFNFEHSGDYLLVASNTTTQTDRGVSSAVTLTDPATVAPAPVASAPIAVSNPGMQFVANPQAGANVPITISAPGLKEAYAFVMNPQNVAEENWIGIPLNSKGQATYDFHFQHTGDYVLAVGNTTTDADKGFSGHISISHN